MTINASPSVVSQTTQSGLRAAATPGMVLECDDRGVLLKICRDDLGLLQGIAPGISFHHLVGRDSLDNAFGFLAEVKQRASVVGWELRFSLACQPTTLFVGGLVKGPLLLIFGTRTRGGLLRLSRFYLNNHYLDTQAQTIPAPIAPTRILNQRELALQEQLSHTQNKLVNLQRALAKKDALLQKVIAELRVVQTGVLNLKGLLPICSSCKRIRENEGYWTQIETYFRKYGGVQFTHGICPDCIKILYSNVLLDQET